MTPSLRILAMRNFIFLGLLTPIFWLGATEMEINNEAKQVIYQYAEIIDSKPIGLMETMSERIIKNLSTNEMVSKIKIRIEKPQAPLPHPGGLAVIEMQWVRPQ